MRVLFFLLLALNVFNTNANINTDILDDTEFIDNKHNNLLNYMNAYYKKIKNCCNETDYSDSKSPPAPSPSPFASPTSSPSPSPSPFSLPDLLQAPPFKWRGIVYLEVLDMIENNRPEMLIV